MSFAAVAGGTAQVTNQELISDVSFLKDKVPSKGPRLGVEDG